MKNLSIGLVLVFFIALFSGTAQAQPTKGLIIVPVTLKVKSVNQADKSVRAFEMKVAQNGKLTIVQGDQVLRPGQFLPNGDYIQDEEVMATLTSSGKILSYGETIPITITADSVLMREGVPFLHVVKGEVRDVSPDKSATISQATVDGKNVEIHHFMTLEAEPQASRLVAYMLAISMMMGD